MGISKELLESMSKAEVTLSRQHQDRPIKGETHGNRYLKEFEGPHGKAIRFKVKVVGMDTWKRFDRLVYPMKRPLTDNHFDTLWIVMDPCSFP